jgi:hypothetical protein
MDLFRRKKGQGLPIQAIIIIIIAVVVLAVIILYVLGVSGKGSDYSKFFFNIGGNVTQNATGTSCEYTGGCA